jgi:hypothetical protein
MCGSRDSSVDIVTATDWTTEKSWFVSGQVQRTSLLSRAFRPALGPTKLPVHWVRVKRPGLRISGAIPLPSPLHVVVEWTVSAVKWLGRVGSHVPPSSAEGKNEWSHTSCPPYGLMDCTGTDLPLPLSVNAE